MIVISDEARRAVQLPNDCGVYDLARGVWHISESDLEKYRPDLAKMLAKYL